MNDFSIGVGSENLIEITGGDMKDYGYQNIAMGFVIESVHYNDEGENT